MNPTQIRAIKRGSRRNSQSSVFDFKSLIPFLSDWKSLRTVMNVKPSYMLTAITAVDKPHVQYVLSRPCLFQSVRVSVANAISS